jgi:hypothetical protein
MFAGLLDRNLSLNEQKIIRTFLSYSTDLQGMQREKR